MAAQLADLEQVVTRLAGGPAVVRIERSGATITVTLEATHVSQILPALAAAPDAHVTATQVGEDVQLTFGSEQPARPTTAVRVPRHLRDRVRDASRQTGEPAAHLIVQALRERGEPALRALAERRRALGLPATAAPRRRRGTGPSTQLWFTPTPEELAYIDKVASAWCGGNRSAAVTVALQEFEKIGPTLGQR